MVQSDATRREWKRIYKIQKKNLAVMPSGLDAPPATIPTPAAQWAGQLANGEYILFFGYLLRRKGLEVLLDAFEATKRIRPQTLLVLAGGELDNQRDYARDLRERASRSPNARDIIF